MVQAKKRTDGSRERYIFSSNAPQCGVTVRMPRGKGEGAHHLPQVQPFFYKKTHGLGAYYVLDTYWRIRMK